MVNCTLISYPMPNNVDADCFNLCCYYLVYKACKLNMKSVNKSLLNRTDVFLIITRS